MRKTLVDVVRRGCLNRQLVNRSAVIASAAGCGSRTSGLEDDRVVVPLFGARWVGPSQLENWVTGGGWISGHASSSGGVQLRWFSSGGDGESSGEMPEKKFHSLANDTLDTLQEKIEAYGEDLDVGGFDLDYSDGVMTVKLGDLGTYVINKQTPNRQLWLSSPVSGPARFDWNSAEGVWVYRRTKAELVTLLEQELSKLLGSPILLKN